MVDHGASEHFNAPAAGCLHPRAPSSADAVASDVWCKDWRSATLIFHDAAARLLCQHMVVENDSGGMSHVHLRDLPDSSEPLDRDMPAEDGEGEQVEHGPSVLFGKPPTRDLRAPEWLLWETRLLAEIRAGNSRAFRVLYDTFASAIFAAAVSKLKDRAAAEDVVAEVFTKAYRGLLGFESRGASVFFWLLRIAKNATIDRLRSRTTERRLFVAENSNAQDVASEQLGADEEADRGRIRRQIDQVLAGLNERYRKVLELRMLDDQPREDCAKQLGVTLGTFDVLFLRSVRAFRKRWTEIYGDTDGSSDTSAKAEEDVP